MLTWDRDAVVDLLLECGRIALGFYEDPGRELKADRSVVTAADRAIEKRMAGVLDDPVAGSYVIGEETIDRRGEDYVRDALSGRAWVVDPVDGTAPYAHHVPTWGISLGMMEGGALQEGAVLLPATGELFVSDGDAVFFARVGAECSAAALRPLEVTRRPWDDGALVAVTQSVTKRRILDLPNPVQALGCAVVPLTYLLLGRYAAYIGSLKLWDFAGGLPLLLKCGFVGKLRNGRRVGAQMTDGLIHLEAGHPRRWGMTEAAVFAASEAMCDAVAGAVQKP
jgi:myo-inositol-1(or 4)-monophosphatase